MTTTAVPHQLTLLQAEHEDFGQEDLREQRPAWHPHHWAGGISKHFLNNQNQTNHCNLIQRADKFAQLKAGLAIQSRASYRLTTSLSGTAQWSPTSSSSLISIIQVPSSSWVWGRSERWRRDLQVQGNELQQEWVLLWSQQPGARQVERYIWVWFTQIQIAFPFQSLFVAKSHQVGEGRLATMQWVFSRR